MTLHQHVLRGCSPAPLAHYLKALGILRLVSEQGDPNCRGAWRDDHFVLVTVLSREELERFFLEEYEPTAMVNPWGARSGFYSGSSEATARSNLNRIQTDDSTRLGKYRAELEKVVASVKGIGGTKPEDGEQQRTLICALGRDLRNGADEWLAAVVPRSVDQIPRPPLLGTGGNEGSGSYTSAYMQAVVETMLDMKWTLALSNSLFGTPQPSVSNWSGSFGQFIPAGLGSPWDLMLALEGSIVVKSNVARKGREGLPLHLSSPFLLVPWPTGNGSCSDGDNVQIRNGKPQPGRGEQWFPLWERFATYREVAKVFEEGRAVVGTRQVDSPIQFAEAAARLGTARGLTSFLRFGYLQRNNSATHFAVPLGHVLVNERTVPPISEELLPWMRKFHRAIRRTSPRPPARLVGAERQLSDAAMAALELELDPVKWQRLLIAAAELEDIQGHGEEYNLGPIPRLSPDWVLACDDGSREFRLAAALGSAGAPYSAEGRTGGPVRHHWLPIEQGCRVYATSDKRIARDSRVVAANRDPCLDLTAVLERRQLESQQADQRHPQLHSPIGADLSDLAHWTAGVVDAQRCVDLARAFMAVDWSKWDASVHRLSRPLVRRQVDDAWAVLRLCCLPFKLDAERDIPFDPQILRRLEVGDLPEAFRVAAQRLRAHGIRPTVRQVIADRSHARWWASALAFPISPATAKRLLTLVSPEASKEIQHVVQP